MYVFACTFNIDEILFIVLVLGYEPAFDTLAENITAIEGKEALLPCSIDHLAKHKVGLNK